MYALSTKPVQKSSTTSRVEESFSASKTYLQKKSQDQADILAKMLHPQRGEIQSKNADNSGAGLPVSLQTKLAVGKADDKYEQEAEEMSNIVVMAPDALNRPTSESAMGEKEKVRAKSLTPVQQVDGSVEKEITAATNTGSFLPDSVQSKMESYFSEDFSNVRIHSDREAIRMNQSLGAHAFTYKNHIFFNKGMYNPSSQAGTRLLAHELTHVVQQGGSAVKTKPVQATTPKIQKLGFGIGDKLNEYADHVPGWRLFTVIIGYNPLTGKKVQRTAKNFLQGVLGLAPGGNQLYQKLNEMGLIDRAFNWVSEKINALNITLALLEQLLSEALDEISLIARNHVEVLKRKFVPLYNKIKSTAYKIGVRLLSLIKEKLVNQFGDFIKTVPGFTLLTLVLKKDPITQKEVKPDAKACVGGILEFVPGGRKKYQDLKKSGKLKKAFYWLQKRIEKLNIKFSDIVRLFKKGWRVLSITDILIPILAFKKLAGIFGNVIGRIAGFAKDVLLKILEFTFVGLLGPTADQVVKILKKSKKTFNLIISNPVRFAGYLLSAVKRGFNKFNKNIVGHLKKGLAGWILGNLQKAGIVIPEKWDLKSVIGLALQIFGITYAKMRLKLVKIFGEKNVARLEKAFEIVRALVTEGPGVLWGKLIETVGNLKDKAVEAIRDWVVKTVVTSAVLKIVALLNPVGAVVQAAHAIYNTIMFFIERIGQIWDLVQSVINSLSLIAVGKIKTAANFVEQSMARTIPLIISFLARHIGLGGLADTVKNIFNKFQGIVDKAIDKVLGWIVNKARGFLQKGKEVVGKIVKWWKQERTVKGKDKSFIIYFEGKEDNAKLYIRSSPGISYSEFLADVKGQIKTPSQKKAHEKAIPLAQRIEKNITSRNKDYQESQALINDLNQMAELVKIMAIKGDLPPSEISYGNLTPDQGGKSAEARILSFNSGGSVGTEPSDYPPIWLAVKERKSDEGKRAYVQGHLLNHNVHGPGKRFNMTPITYKANSAHKEGIEKEIKSRVLDNDKKEIVFYKIVAHYDGHPESEDYKKLKNLPNKNEKQKKQLQAMEADRALCSKFDFEARVLKPKSDGTYEKTKSIDFDPVKNIIPKKAPSEVPYTKPSPINLNSDFDVSLLAETSGLELSVAAAIKELRKSREGKKLHNYHFIEKYIKDNVDPNFEEGTLSNLKREGFIKLG